jgi:hypothetical protein
VRFGDLTLGKKDQPRREPAWDTNSAILAGWN